MPPFDAAAADLAAGPSPTASAFLSSLESPASEAQAHDSVRGARAMFQRTLASWASDMLILQHRGLHQATWETAANAHRLRRAA